MSRGRPRVSVDDKLVYKCVGMKQEHWDEIKNAAENRGWSVNKYMRNIAVNFARGKLVNPD